MRLANAWLGRLSDRRRFYSLQHHADQELDELRAFWGVPSASILRSMRFQRKSNSAQLAHRRWRSRYGVLTVGVNDTQLRARLQGWIDLLQDQWLISASRGV